MLWLNYVMVTIQNNLLWLECRHRDVCTIDQCRRQQGCVPLQLTHQTDAASTHSHPALFGRLAAPDFIMKYNEVRAGLFIG